MLSIQTSAIVLEHKGNKKYSDSDCREGRNPEDLIDKISEGPKENHMDWR